MNDQLDLDFLRMEDAAERVTLATAFSVRLFAAPNSRSVSVFPPKTNATTISKMIRVSGIARTGDANHKRMSSKAAIPRIT